MSDVRNIEQVGMTLAALQNDMLWTNTHVATIALAIESISREGAECDEPSP